MKGRRKEEEVKRGGEGEEKKGIVGESRERVKESQVLSDSAA